MNKSIDASDRRVLQIDGTLNFRDLGGYQSDFGGTVKWGLVYRSAQLDKISDHGLTKIADMGLKTLIDLRFEEERSAFPTRAQAFPQARVFTWQGERGNANIAVPVDKQGKQNWRDSLESGDPKAVKEAMRVNYPHKLYSHAGIYRRMLMCLIDSQSPLVFHCAAGKDRTGIAAAIILGVLGVSNAQIREDYLLTQSLIEGRMEHWIGTGAADSYDDFQDKLARQSAEMLKPVLAADPDYIDTLMDYVDQQHNGFYPYVKKVLALDEPQIKQLRAGLLE